MRKIISFLIIILFAHIFMFNKLYSQCIVGTFEPGFGIIQKTTGNLSLDNKINNEANLISQVFHVNPNLFIYQEEQGPNALASPQTTNPMSTGSVYLGVQLLREQLWNMNRGEIAVAGIMAHEFAHIMQMKEYCSLSTFHKELHADFMAGYYMGRKSYLTDVNIQGFANSLFSIGDTNFWSPSHHGTPSQRVNSMITGFNNKNESVDNAYAIGIDYVSQIQIGQDTGPISNPNPAPNPNEQHVIQQIVPCIHPAHSGGDVIPCIHPAHTNDFYPCQHACSDGFNVFPCHPYGDIGPCMHTLHPQGDIIPCMHPLHPDGDIIYVNP